MTDLSPAFLRGLWELHLAGTPEPWSGELEKLPKDMAYTDNGYTASRNKRLSAAARNALPDLLRNIVWIQLSLLQPEATYAEWAALWEEMNDAP